MAASLTRRSFISRGLAVSASSVPAFHVPVANAAEGYRALVCIFLYGGNDGNNMVVPIDSQAHSLYKSARGALALPADKLIPIADGTVGVHPAMSALKAAAQAGQLAPVLNIGTLSQRITKADFQFPSRLPEALFSHSHQQILWETGGPVTSSRVGWGGKASEILNAGKPVISIGSAGRFGISASTSPLVLPFPGANFGLEGLSTPELWSVQAKARLSTIQALNTTPRTGAINNAYVVQQSRAMLDASNMAALVKVTPGTPGAVAAIDTAFAPLTTNGVITNSLARQLYQVAKVISERSPAGGTRPIFFTQLGGFDTHANQTETNSVLLGRHASLLKQLGDAMAAFQNAMNNLGIGGSVTTFTQSEFGRTLVPNGAGGSDHGWGNHQLVLGGAVRGAATYGQMPDFVIGGDQDAAFSSNSALGRWIPSVSVDQYAGTLLRWLGASTAQINNALPNLANTGGTTLSFV